MSDDNAQLLRDDVRNGMAVVLAGCGVSMATTGDHTGGSVASWRGLLTNGLAFVESECRPDDVWLHTVRTLIGTKKVPDWLSAADRIRDTLEEHKKYGAWLAETVGRLDRTYPEVPDAILGLGVPVLTTNYDTLIEGADGANVTWADGAAFQRVVNGTTKRKVAHLHGVWDRPATVVFGQSDYGELKHQETIQAILRAAGLAKSFVFVGVGAGTDDPNLGSLLQWVANTIPDGSNRHYWLCPTLAARDCPKTLRAVPFGRREDLARFLRDLNEPEVVRIEKRPVSQEDEAAIAAPRPWRTMLVDGPWAAFTVSDGLHVLTAASDVVCRTGESAARGPFGTFVGSSLQGLALVADGSFAVAQGDHGLWVFVVDAVDSFQRWPFEFPMTNCELLTAHNVTAPVPTIDVVVTGTHTVRRRLVRRSRWHEPPSVEAPSLPTRDEARGAGVVLRATLETASRVGAVRVRREEHAVAEERRLPIADPAAVTRLIVARPVRGRSAPSTVLVQSGNEVSAWRWDDLPASPGGTS